MAQIKLNGTGKERIAVYKDGQIVARLEYRKLRHNGKTRRVLSGPVRLITKQRNASLDYPPPD